MTPRPHPPSNRTIRVLATFSILFGACANETGSVQADRYDVHLLARSLDDPKSDAGLMLGEYPLAARAVVDGDTIRVDGLDASLRLLAIDTEETFKTAKDWADYQAGFDAYLAKKQSETDRPVKVATPMGTEAKKYAEQFFKGVGRVRLERDHPKELRDFYNRHLAYVFAEKNGKWVNYNVECVRAGMTPYFTKYGYSRRFHDAFVEAEQEARAAKRGVWDPGKEHYRDYDQRRRWWDARGKFIYAFEHDKSEVPHVALTNWDAMERMEHNEGEQVEVLALVARIFPARGRAPTRVLLAQRDRKSFPIIFFDQDAFERSRIAEAEGEFVRVRGTVTRYRPKGRKAEEQLQIVIHHPSQVTISATAIAASKVGSASPKPATASGRKTPPTSKPAPLSPAQAPTAEPSSVSAPPATTEPSQPSAGPTP